MFKNLFPNILKQECLNKIPDSQIFQEKKKRYYSLVAIISTWQPAKMAVTLI